MQQFKKDKQKCEYIVQIIFKQSTMCSQKYRRLSSMQNALDSGYYHKKKTNGKKLQF